MLCGQIYFILANFRPVKMNNYQRTTEKKATLLGAV